MKVNVQLTGGPTEWARRSIELADLGVAGAFTFEGQHDVFLPLALAADATGGRLDLMTNIAVALPRSPLHLAQLSHDLRRLSAGRFRLGLGTQVKGHIERRYGGQWSEPAARMREIVEATRELLTAWQEQRPPHFEGRFTRHTLMPPMFTPPPLADGVPPILMGALGPVMTRTAAEVADGLLVMPFNTRRNLDLNTLPAIAEGLRRSSRTRAELTLVPQVIVATVSDADPDPATAWTAALAGARRLVAFYATTPAYRSVLEAHGWGALQDELHALSRAGRTDEFPAAVDDEVLRTIAVAGTPQECAEQIAERFADLADEVCVYFPGGASDRAIGELTDSLWVQAPPATAERADEPIDEPIDERPGA